MASATLLAGLQKTTLIDYPGKIACVVFFSGCNFHCPYCHNPSLAKGQHPNPLSLKDLTAFLDQRRGFLEGVVITGGEPTLSPRLGDLCRCCHALGLAVKLDTNGSRPEVLSQVIDQGLIDYVAMDIKTIPQRYDLLCGQTGIGDRIVASVHFLLNRGRDFEFRTTCARPFVDEAVVDEIGQLIQGAPLYVLQTFQAGDLLDPTFGCQDDRGYSASEMVQLQRVAAAWVKQCRIR